MSDDVPQEARTWDEGDEAMFQLKIGLRRARSVLDAAKSDIQQAIDALDQREPDARD